MTDTPRTRHIAVTGLSTLALISDAISAALLFASRATSEITGDRSGRVQAEAATPGELIPRLLENALAIADDLGSTPVQVSIDGIRPIEGGYRSWGVITLGPAAVPDYRAPRIVGTPVLVDRNGVFKVDIDIELG